MPIFKPCLDGSVPCNKAVKIFRQHLGGCRWSPASQRCEHMGLLLTIGDAHERSVDI